MAGPAAALWRVALAGTALLGALSPAEAGARPLHRICEAPGARVSWHALGPHTEWQEEISLPGRAGSARVRVRAWARDDRGAWEVAWVSQADRIELLRMRPADLGPGAPRLKLIEADGRPVMLAAATEAGMRYVGVALWAFGQTGEPPRPVQVGKADARAMAREGVEPGTVASNRRAPMFRNPHLRCEGGALWLVETWFVAGEQGVTCWRFGSDTRVVPAAAFRATFDDNDEMPGARSAIVVRFTPSIRGMRAVRTRVAGASASAVDAPTCAELTGNGIGAR